MKRKIIVLCLLLIAVLGAGCAGPVQKEDERPINIGIHDDINGLDVAGTKDMLSENVSRCIFSTLFVYDEQMNVVPSLAKDYEQISEREWLFTIYDTVKFHDGSPLTAADIKYSIERAQNHAEKDAALDAIASVEVVNDTTVSMVTVFPNVDLPSVLLRVSASVMSEKAMQSSDYDLYFKPVGSGPFRVLERKAKEIIRLERFDDYFLEPAKTKYLNFVVNTSETSRTAALLNGSIDVLFRVSSYDCDALKLNDAVEVYQTDSSKMELFVLNPAHPPLDNEKVRRALAHAINKEALVDKVLDGYGVPLASALPNTLMGFTDKVDLSYDPALARALLAEAGFPDGIDVTLINYDGLRKKQLEYIKLDLAEVGVRMEYEIMELGAYVTALEENENEISVINWTCNADPDSVFSQLYSKSAPPTLNHARFTHPEVERLIEAGRTEREIEARRRIYEEANRLVMETGIILPLYQPMVLVAASKEIHGLMVNPQGPFGYERLSRVPVA